LIPFQIEFLYQIEMQREKYVYLLFISNWEINTSHVNVTNKHKLCLRKHSFAGT